MLILTFYSFIYEEDYNGRFIMKRKYTPRNDCTG